MGLRLIDSAHIVYSLIGLGICFALLWKGCSVQAQGAWPEWTEEAKLDLARCIMAESDFNNEREAAAISWVLIKRWRLKKGDRSIGRVITKYCALWDTRSSKYYGQRKERIRASTWTDSRHGTPKQWRDLKVVVETFQNRKTPDPCPIATHWAGREDRIPPTWTCPCRFAPRGNVFCYPQK